MLEVHVPFSVPYVFVKAYRMKYSFLMINVKTENRWKKNPAQPLGAKKKILHSPKAKIKILTKTKLPNPPPQKYNGPSLTSDLSRKGHEKKL